LLIIFYPEEKVKPEVEKLAWATLRFTEEREKLMTFVFLCALCG
jgi:hypothetical protein